MTTTTIQNFAESLRFLLATQLGLTLGYILLAILLIRVVPKPYRSHLFSIFRRKMAQRIRKNRFPKGSIRHDLAEFVASALIPIRRPLPPAKYITSARPKQPNRCNQLDYTKKRNRYPAFDLNDLTNLKPQAVNRHYSTYSKQTIHGSLTNEPAHNAIIKVSESDVGDRILTREHRVLQRLHRVASMRNYEGYLPNTPLLYQSDRHLVSVGSFNSNSQFTLADVRSVYQEGLDGRHVGWIFNRTLEILGFIHQQQTIHAAILPQHLILNVQTHGLQLVDWTHAKRRGKPIGYFDPAYQHWYPIEAARELALPAFDIYMAAKCAVFAAGADPRTNLVPCHLPKPMRNFLRSCLLESVRMRPTDAWQLHDEFRDLLEDVYGSPKFHHLEMS